MPDSFILYLRRIKTQPKAKTVNPCLSCQPLAIYSPRIVEVKRSKEAILTLDKVLIRLLALLTVSGEVSINLA